MWGVTAPSNKGMKLTKPEHIGALQLIPGVRRTSRECQQSSYGGTIAAHGA
jgi:hypothetical protein